MLRGVCVSVIGRECTVEIGDWAWLRISACTEPESRLHTSLGVGNVCFALHVAAKLDRREAPQTVACSWRDHACVLPVAVLLVWGMCASRSMWRPSLTGERPHKQWHAAGETMRACCQSLLSTLALCFRSASRPPDANERRAGQWAQRPAAASPGESCYITLL